MRTILIVGSIVLVVLLIGGCSVLAFRGNGEAVAQTATARPNISVGVVATPTLGPTMAGTKPAPVIVKTTVPTPTLPATVQATNVSTVVSTVVPSVTPITVPTAISAMAPKFTGDKFKPVKTILEPLGFKPVWPADLEVGKDTVQCTILNGQKVWCGFPLRAGSKTLISGIGLNTPKGFYANVDGTDACFGMVALNTSKLDIYVSIQYGEGLPFETVGDLASLGEMYLRAVTTSNRCSTAYLGVIDLAE